jgi:tetratricopeptide (TPR) repeat protein
MAKNRSRGVPRGRVAALDPKVEATRFYGMGRYREALKSASVALRRRPEDAELWNLSGGAALALGLTQDAQQFWNVAIARDPGYADAHYNLGVLHYGRRDLPAAARSFMRTLALSPNHAAALNNLGALLQHLGSFAEATTLLQRAVRIDPCSAEAFNNLGLALLELERFEEAGASLDQALRLRPRFAAALTNRARICIECGEPLAAQKFLAAALEADPDYGEAHYGMSRLLRATSGMPWIGQLEGAYARRASLPVRSASALSFAMGKVREDLAEYTAAFEAYAEGNRLCYAQRPFDEAADQRAHAGRTTFGAELYAGESATESAAAEPAPAQPVPVFVVGMPRSGTSLVEQVLASHPEVSGAGELALLAELTARVPLCAPAGAERAAWLAQLRALGREYVTRAARSASRGRFLVDKMPGNYLHLGLLPLMIPAAKIIHMQRDALDTCLSCYTTPFVRGHEYSFDLGMLARRYRRYERLMAHWAQVLPPKRVLTVRYEALVSDLEHEARRMLAYLGLQWDEACLNFHETRRAVRTASAAQVRRPLYVESVARWRRFERELGPLQAALASG